MNSDVQATTDLLSESAWDRIERTVSQGRLTDAEEFLDRIASPQTRAAMRLRYARLLVAAADGPRARKTLDKCLREEPMLIEAQLMKASFAEESGDLNLAEQACRRALYLDRHCVIAHFHLALVLRQKDEQDGWRRSLQTVLKLIGNCDPHSVVEFSDGMCCGRLREMVNTLLDF